MTQLKHSPRPWRLDPDGCFVYDADGEIVCQLFGKSEEDFANSEANGPVLAAAPDALQTCRDVLSDCFLLRDLPHVGAGPQDFITAHLIAPLRLVLAGAAEAPGTHKLVVRMHGEGWRVHLDGRPGEWDYGATRAEALCNWFVSHAARLGIEIVNTHPSPCAG